MYLFHYEIDCSVYLSCRALPKTKGLSRKIHLNEISAEYFTSIISIFFAYLKCYAVTIF